MIGSDPRYQAIIDAYRAGELSAAVPPYNPIYDIRREQIEAGELPPGSRFPNPQLDTTPTETPAEETFDPCPPGYQLIDGVCQPDTMFQQGGDGGDRTEFESPYLGDIYTPMANDPINTELRRFAAQADYQPTFGSSVGELFRKGMQLSPFVGLLNALGLGPSYTQKVTPRFEGSAMPTGATGAPLTAIMPSAAEDINRLVSSGASQSAAESAVKAANNKIIQDAAQQAFKQAQTEQAKKESEKQRFRMITSVAGKSYTGGPTFRSTSGMLGGGV
jgi:hypothetical protein